MEELPNQVVQGNVVSVETTHFSKYILLNKTEFDIVWNSEIKPPNYNSEFSGLDIVFVIDSSASMWRNDRNNVRLEAAKAFVDKLGIDDRAAVVDFHNVATLCQDFTDNHSLLKSAIQQIGNGGRYTDLSSGIKLAISQFKKSSYTREDAYKYIIFLTDGDRSYSSRYTTLAANNNITIYTIGLGDEVNSNLLDSIAVGTGGKYYFASTADTLPQIYDDIAVDTIDYSKDSNNDGISDYYTKLICEGKLVSGTGINLFEGVSFEALQANDDYDGDGIKNGDEAKLSFNTQDNSPQIYYASDPCQKDGDNDGIPDSEDTAPFEKGLEGGIIGNITLIAAYGSGMGSDAFKSGHAFLLYESYVNDSIDFSNFSSGWSKKDNNDVWSSSNIQRDDELKSNYKVYPHDILTIGNGALTAGFAHLGNIFGGGSSSNGSSGGSSSGGGSSGSSSSGDGSSSGGGSSGDSSSGGSSSGESSSGGSASEANGSSYNMEIYKSCDLGYTYLKNTAISMKITEANLNTVIEYFGREEENYWSAFHNCATVASSAWNLISEQKVDAEYMAGVSTPRALSDNIRTKDEYIIDYNLSGLLGER